MCYNKRVRRIGYEKLLIKGGTTNPTTGGRHISMTLAAFLTLIFGKGADAA
jgi:hypothetical protein